jgi:predicted transcriptional regulator
MFEDEAPIPKQQIIRQVRQAPIKGLKLHATGSGSEIINPGREVPVRYSGYAEDGFIGGTQRERVLYINKKDLPGDPGTYPSGMFGGESVPRHEFQIPSEDDTYIVGWSRLTDRMGILPTRLEAPKTKSNIPGLTRERERAQRQVAGLYAEAINKLNREGVRRGLNQADLDVINELSLEQMLTDYGDTLGEISPGLLDQIDELIVKVRDLDTEIAKGSAVDTSGVVKVAFVDEMQSDIMQKATERKQQLAAALRKIQEEGEGTTIEGLNRQARQVVDFFEKNKTVFRPLEKTEEEAAKIGEKIRGLDERVDEIVRDYIDTREISQENINELQTLLNDNINSLLNEIIEIDSSTVDKLFPDLPFKNRDEWADAIVKSNLYELAYKKFVLKEADAPEYYAITPSRLVSKRYSFVGDTATPAADRAEDKARRIQQFKNEGTFGASRFKGIGMAEFYGGPKAVDESGKHYTSTLEKILKKQAKENNSEIVTMPVQTRAGGDDVFRITDQNGNMVATLTDERQANLVLERNRNYKVERMRVPDEGSTTPVFAIKITKEMLEPYKTHKAMGGLVQLEDIFEV